MLHRPLARPASAPTSFRCRWFSAAIFGLTAFLAVETSAQLVWMRSGATAGTAVETGDKLRLKVGPREKAAFYTTGFPPVLLDGPGVTATVVLNASFEGNLAEADANNTRFLTFGLYDNRGTSPGNSFEDDCGYYLSFKSVTVDRNMIELRKRLGNGKSASLLPAAEARANMNTSRSVDQPGVLAEKTPYRIVFSLTRDHQGGIMFKGGPSGHGVSVSGGGVNYTAVSSEADASPESTTFNQFGIVLDNKSSADLSLIVDSIQLEFRQDGRLVSVSSGPEITVQPRDVVATVGSAVTLTVAAKGEAVAYQWKKNGHAIPGAVGSTCVIEEASLADGGSYTVEAANPYGVAESAPAVLTFKHPVMLSPGAAPSEQIVFTEEQVEAKPVPARPVHVRYPKAGLPAAVSGTNVLRFIVTAEGHVDGIQVANFIHDDLIGPLMVAYQNARYEPGKKNGKPVNTLVTVSVPYPPAK